MQTVSQTVDVLNFVKNFYKFDDGFVDTGVDVKGLKMLSPEAVSRQWKNEVYLTETGVQELKDLAQTPFMGIETIVINLLPISWDFSTKVGPSPAYMSSPGRAVISRHVKWQADANYGKDKEMMHLTVEDVLMATRTFLPNCGNRPMWQTKDVGVVTPYKVSVVQNGVVFLTTSMV